MAHEGFFGGYSIPCLYKEAHLLEEDDKAKVHEASKRKAREALKNNIKVIYICNIRQWSNPKGELK